MPYREYERLHGTGRDGSALEALLSHAALIRRLGEVNRIRHVSVFGSVARGEETHDSDVDLLVEPAENATLFDLAQFSADMELLLGRRIDTISRAALDPHADRAILNEARPL